MCENFFSNKIQVCLSQFINFRKNQSKQTNKNFVFFYICIYIHIRDGTGANRPVFGPSAKVLKQSASNFFSDDVIPGRCSLLAKNFCFLQSFII